MSGNFDEFRGTRQGNYFDSWTNFINQYAKDMPKSLGGAIRAINKSDGRLSENLKDESVLHNVPLRDVIAPNRSAPWPTFVLGSGCLSARDWPSSKGGTSKENLTNALARVQPDSELRGLAVNFVDNLAINRSEQPLDSAGLTPAQGKERTPSDWDYIAETAVAAMLLTRLYGNAIAASIQIVTDSHREQITLPKDAQFRRALVVPLNAVLDSLANNADRDQPVRASLASLASSVSSSVKHDEEVQRAHVELLTAFLWFLLTEDTFLYPDWSDLLLFEAFMDKALLLREPAWRDSQLKPTTTAMGTAGPVASWLTHRLQAITENSWGSRTGSRRKLTPRDEFYDSLAALLGQQADNYHSFEEAGAKSSRHKPPLPTSFVTTFDLELEMAMWQRSLTYDEPRPFIVILPVVMPVDEKGGMPSNSSVKLRWVWREVVPTSEGDQLEALRHGGPGAWKLLESALPRPLINTPEDWGRTPIIVRLAGSPLMTVTMKGMTNLRQALLLDEYTAVSQTVLDLTAAAQNQSNRNTADFTKGLPPVLTSSNLNPTTAYMPRYWMFLGTQLSDAGVRLRLLSNQITFAQENVMNGVVENVAGVAINRRSRPTDRDVFHWFGLDVVRADDVVTSTTGPLKALHAELEGVFAHVKGTIEAAQEEMSA